MRGGKEEKKDKKKKKRRREGGTKREKRKVLSLIPTTNELIRLGLTSKVQIFLVKLTQKIIIES